MPLATQPGVRELGKRDPRALGQVVVLEAVGEDLVGAVVGVAEEGGFVAVDGVFDLAGHDVGVFVG